MPVKPAKKKAKTVKKVKVKNDGSKAKAKKVKLKETPAVAPQLESEI